MFAEEGKDLVSRVEIILKALKDPKLLLLSCGMVTTMYYHYLIILDILRC